MLGTQIRSRSEHVLMNQTATSITPLNTNETGLLTG